MPRPRRAPSSFSPKSLPTTATRFTGTKNEAATAKNDALPPRTFSARPNGVSTVSYATLPTTRTDILLISGGHFGRRSQRPRVPPEPPSFGGPNGGPPH